MFWWDYGFDNYIEAPKTFIYIFLSYISLNNIACFGAPKNRFILIIKTPTHFYHNIFKGNQMCGNANKTLIYKKNVIKILLLHYW